MERLVVTGSSGFVGRSLAARAGRAFAALHLGGAEWRRDVERASYRDAAVIHLAARVHREGDGEPQFQRDNVEKTRELALAACAGGARRLVFLSSVKVLGEESPGRALRADDPPSPRDAYARSKWAAELELAAIARTRGLETVVVRSPLVFGAGAAGNLRALLRLADSPWPLPLGAVANRRSFVHVDDLARLLLLCADAPAAAGRTFLAAHPLPFSTPRLVELLRRSLGRPARLVRMPVALLEVLASLAGRGREMRRLTRSLEVDASGTESGLGWRAEASLEAAVAEMAAAWRAGAAS